MTKHTPGEWAVWADGDIVGGAPQEEPVVVCNVLRRFREGSQRPTESPPRRTCWTALVRVVSESDWRSRKDGGGWVVPDDSLEEVCAAILQGQRVSRVPNKLVPCKHLDYDEKRYSGCGKIETCEPPLENVRYWARNQTFA